MEPLRTIQGPHRSYDERLTMEAWENLLSGKEFSPAPLCDWIVRSWDRCRSSNVNPSLLHTPELVTRLFGEELEKLIANPGRDLGTAETFREARRISEAMILNGEFDPA